MAVTIDDCYRYAAETGKWRSAFIVTEVVDESGAVVKPHDDVSRNFLSYKLEALRSYCVESPLVAQVVRELQAGIDEFSARCGV